MESQSTPLGMGGSAALTACREVMLVGSVPLKPASSVFDCIYRHRLAPLMKRIPDGEQGGWGGDTLFFENPAFERFGPKRKVTLRPTTFFDRSEWQFLRLKADRTVLDVEIGEFGIARHAKESYADFKKFKEEGKFGAGTRFCVTFAGPGTKFGLIAMPTEALYPLMVRSFKAEIARVLQVAPRDELTIQLDLAGEVEVEEYRRRPQDFELPILHENQGRWKMDGAVGVIANIAAAVPKDVELGFHLCSIYHVDESKGQDLNVHVDYANALSQKIKRNIGYIHMPTVPSHDEKDFEALKRLRLHPETKLFLGVIHVQDGLEGARRRIRAASQSYADFGVASYCGLGYPSRTEYAHPHTVDEILELHRQVAELG